MNLLQETKEVIEENGFTMQDIVWVGTDDVEIPFSLFVELADKEYDNGYGAPHVATDLIVCGDSWYLERHEYDGSEWWEFKTMKMRPERIVNPRVIVDDRYMWDTLKDMNHPKGPYSDEPFDWEGMEVVV